MPINLELGQKVRSDPWGSAFSTLFLIILNLKCNPGSPGFTQPPAIMWFNDEISNDL